LTSETILTWARAFERLSIVGLSGLSLVLGWDLFKRGILEAQSADFKIKDWMFKFQKVGPGIFFAFFATATFVSALYRPLTIAPGSPNTFAANTPNDASRTIQNPNIQYESHPQQAPDSVRIVKSINTIQRLALPRVEAVSKEEEITALRKAADVLESYKRELMYEQYGADSVLFYQIHDDVVSTPSILSKQSKDFQAKYEDMERFDKETFLEDRK
jgi:hypothetical protein